MDSLNSALDQEVTEMKKVFWALGLTLVFNLSGLAQQQKKSPEAIDGPSDQSTKQNKNNKSRSSTSNSMSSLSAATMVQAQLESALDVRNAKVGDQVVLKTTQAIKQNGEVVVPKGSNLIGHVTEVQQRARNGAASKLGLVFDKLQGRDISTPITATIVSITNAHAAGNASDILDSDVSGSSTTSTRSSSGGSSGGGGLLGGVTNTVGGVVNSTTQTVGGVTNSATRTAGGTTQTLGQTLNGIQISTSASGSAQSSTVLSSPNSNIRLDKGVTFNLQVQKSGGN